jgi:hypothetical protein
VFGLAGAGTIYGYLNTYEIMIYIDSAKFESGPVAQTIPSPGWGGDPGILDTAVFHFTAPWPDSQITLYARISAGPWRYPILRPQPDQEYRLMHPTEPYEARVIFSLTGAVEEQRPEVMPGLGLSAPVPNPFSTRTQFVLTCPRTQKLTAAILNASGARVRTLAEGRYAAGELRLTWDGTDDQHQPVPAGLYFCRLVAGNRGAVRKVLLQR